MCLKALLGVPTVLLRRCYIEVIGMKLMFGVPALSCTFCSLMSHPSKGGENLTTRS
ncbi:hypothetical protein AHAS_Ahas09G0148300 [Arachis hypogaea]